jgi:hypothetical protein
VLIINLCYNRITLARCNRKGIPMLCQFLIPLPHLLASDDSFLATWSFCGSSFLSAIVTFGNFHHMISSQNPPSLPLPPKYPVLWYLGRAWFVARRALYVARRAWFVARWVRAYIRSSSFFRGTNPFARSNDLINRHLEAKHSPQRKDVRTADLIEPDQTPRQHFLSIPMIDLSLIELRL